MIGAAVLISAIAFVAYKLGVGHERIRQAKRYDVVLELNEELERAAAGGLWRRR